MGTKFSVHRHNPWNGFETCKLRKSIIGAHLDSLCRYARIKPSLPFRRAAEIRARHLSFDDVLVRLLISDALLPADFSVVKEEA